MKVISVPTSLEAMARLDTDSCISGDLEEVELTQIEFDELCESGLFNSLNFELGLMIDEFEDEAISTELINHAYKVFNAYVVNKQNFEHQSISRLESLFKLAKEKNTGIFFFF